MLEIASGNVISLLLWASEQRNKCCTARTSGLRSVVEKDGVCIAAFGELVRVFVLRWVVWREYIPYFTGILFIILPQLSKCVVFWYNYTSRKDSTMFRPNSSRHQDDQHALTSTSLDQENHLLFGASVYTASYKHNCIRAHSTSHTSLITTS